jgi:hypothetical protein
MSKTGFIEVYYRAEGLDPLRSWQDVRMEDYVKDGPTLPLAEFETIDQVLEAAYWEEGRRPAGGMFSRSVRAHDLIAYKIRGPRWATVPVLVVDMDEDKHIFSGEDVPIQDRVVFRVGCLPVGLFKLAVPWRLHCER